MKEQGFFCGRNLICVTGETSLLSSLALQRKFLADAGKGPAVATLHLMKGHMSSKKSVAEGWSAEVVGENIQATYYSKDQPVFSLIRDSINEIVICISGSATGYVRIAVQYGMMLSLCPQCIGLHGLTLLCGDEIVILSAPSGTGKTTLANLLEEYFEAITINGDFALLSPTDEGVIFEPTPFCGSSGRSLNHRLKVDRLVFLQQAKENKWRDMSGREALLKIMDNAFVPSWDGSLASQVQENAMKCISSLKVDSFGFFPDREAAEVFYNKQRLDS